MYPRGMAQHSVHVEKTMLDELRREAERLERPLSWVLRVAWQVAREAIRRMPPPALPEGKPGPYSGT